MDRFLDVILGRMGVSFIKLEKRYVRVIMYIDILTAWYIKRYYI